MGNATRWYSTLEAVKESVGVAGADRDAAIARALEAASSDIEQLLAGRRFIPETATKYYRWPPRAGRRFLNPWSRSYAWPFGESAGWPLPYGERDVLRFPDQDLLAVTTLQSQAQDSSPTTIPAADYFLEPNDQGPPYDRIEIDLSSSSAFDAGATPQRSISVAGRWGYSEDTKAAGALAEALDDSETGVDVTDASLIGVGDTLLIDSEAMFVSARPALTTGTTLSGNPTASMSDVTIGVADGTAVHAGEVILVDSERMFVTDVAGNNLTVKRAYDATVLAAHSAGATVYAYRTLTVTRGVNGTTAATHSNGAAISKYAPPGDIVELCTAIAIAHLKQHESGWTGQIAGGEGAVNVRMVDLFYLRQRVVEKYGRVNF